MRRTTLTGGLIGLSALALSGCLGPTYGTDTPATEQLFQDLSSAVAPTSERREPIAYQPRPELVRPASTTVLPTPQDSATRTSGNWPESPEQRLARLRSDGAANEDNPFYRAPVQTTTTSLPDVPVDPDAWENMTPQQQRAEYERRASSRAGSPNTRRYLSEPPVDYRMPAESAPANELGEDEWRKERDIRRASGSGGWRDWMPWL
ncbi:MAG: hypothetical protein MEQ84_02040 [Mesorhizobium sp.]|nr:hypothetical protein [Mesorhizobium sp.]